MKKYNCIIVDDETLAQELIETHLQKIPNIEVVAKCHTAMEALGVLKERHIDIMFLDIEMPDISGIELLKSLSIQPYTIFTTAYSEYAVESYELNVVDYILKPVTFERFFKAVSKVMDLLNIKVEGQQNNRVEEIEEDYIFVKSDYKAVKVRFDDIIYAESMQKYVQFHLNNSRVMTLMSLTHLAEILPNSKFFRCQKSFIVNLHKIDGVDGNQLIMSSGDKVPVSKAAKAELFSRIDKRGLFSLLSDLTKFKQLLSLFDGLLVLCCNDSNDIPINHQ